MLTPKRYATLRIGSLHQPAQRRGSHSANWSTAQNSAESSRRHAQNCRHSSNQPAPPRCKIVASQQQAHSMTPTLSRSCKIAGLNKPFEYTHKGTSAAQAVASSKNHNTAPCVQSTAKIIVQATHRIQATAGTYRPILILAASAALYSICKPHTHTHTPPSATAVGHLHPKQHSHLSAIKSDICCPCSKTTIILPV